MEDGGQILSCGDQLVEIKESPGCNFAPNEPVRHPLHGCGIAKETRFQPDGSQSVAVFFPQGNRAWNLVTLDADDDGLTHGWDDAVQQSVNPKAYSVKQSLFGEDLTAEDVAYALELDRTTILRYLRDGTLAGYQVGREWRIPSEELPRYKQRLLAGATVDRKLALLRNNYQGRTWRRSVCVTCLLPILQERHWDGWVGDCDNCQNQSHDELSETGTVESESSPPESESDIDGMPF